MNTIHSVSNTSRMRSSEAIAVRNSFSFRSLMMRVMLVMAIVVGGKVAWADSYTIKFRTGSSDGTEASTSTACSTIVSEGAAYLSGNLVTATKVYYSGSSGLKLGTSKAAGTIKMNLSLTGQVTPTSIVVRAKRYNAGTSTTLKVNGSTAQTINNSSSFNSYTFNINSRITYLELISTKYTWIESITVNYTSTYTITAVSNDNSLGTVSLVENIITASHDACVYFETTAYTVTRGTATVIQDGDNFIVSPSSNCTIQINFAEKPIYNIGCNVNGIVSYSNYCEGTAIPAIGIPSPSSSNCNGTKIFVGWSESEFEVTDAWPTMIARNQLVGVPISDDKLYYAVFANANPDNASLNTTLWSETWTGGGTSTPSAYGFSGTTVYNNASLTYAQTSPDATTKLWNENLASGTAPELLLSKSNGTWTISNLPTGGAIEMSFTFKSNKTTFAVTSSTADVEISGSEKSWIITVEPTVTNFEIEIKNTGSQNARIDDIELKVTKINATGYTTFCPCNYGTIPGIANGDFVWAGKNAETPLNDWSSKDNWVVYNLTEGEFHLTGSAPEGNKVFILNKDGECGIDAIPTLTSNVTCNNITLSSNMGINLDEYNLTVTGSLTNDGSEITGTGKVIFAGTSAQTISGATTFGNVKFDNENGISANAEPIINGEATFSNGVLTGDVVFGEDATVSGVSTSSYVDGKVTKNGSANSTDFFFPTGSSGNLGKVEVSSDVSGVSVQYYSNPAGFSSSDLPRWWASASVCGLDHVSNVEYWKIETSEPIEATFTAQASTDMHFNNDPENARDEDDIQMAFYGSNCWSNVGGTTTIDENTITITGATIPASSRSISGNYIAPASKSKNTVLPIELTSFSATCAGTSVNLAWTTASERNNDYFIVESSHDAVNFNEIARVAGAGNSIEQQDYNYIDYSAADDDNYYRLVQVDYDGTRTASEIVVANCYESDGEPDVHVFPNPFHNDVAIHIENLGGATVCIEVYDMLGKLVHQKTVSVGNENEITLNLQNLPNGAYNFRVSANDYVFNKQVIKQ